MPVPRRSGGGPIVSLSILLALGACAHSPPQPPAAGPAGIDWVLIPGGSFKTHSSVVGPQPGPLRRVRLKTFYLSRTPVTNKQYAACVRAGACAPARDYGAHLAGEDQPIIGVTWYQAKAFSEWAGGRLPTGAQWEYAARGGGRDQLYPWGDEAISCERAVVFDRALGGAGCGRLATWPVCSKPLGNTKQGVCDMGGNVYEWTEDLRPGTGPGTKAETARDERVIRGRPWDEPTGAVSSIDSEMEAQDAEYDYLGFRPAR